MAGHHFEYDDPQTPIVHCQTVSFERDQFGCHVIGSATQRISSSSIDLFDHAEVGQPHITIDVQQHVLWFQIPVHQARQVQEFYGQYYLHKKGHLIIRLYLPYYNYKAYNLISIVRHLFSNIYDHHTQIV